MSLIRKHVAVLQAWACLDLVLLTTEVSLITNLERDNYRPEKRSTAKMEE